MKDPWDEMRDAMEGIVRTLNLDRRTFHEVSKKEYAGVLKRLYFTFFDYSSCPDIPHAYWWVRLRKSLCRSERVQTDWKD